ncbi:hypothetical protein [Pseudorhodoferax sp.]|uniref:hypothetical protein n=1 Tax=Pseudorhodoferax sp. TaxID=1993553 RepID=UPI002DD65F76|nr:hypothetical protein [Pseudorhodoferax sp.]
METAVDRAFNEGCDAYVAGLSRLHNPWQETEATPLRTMQAWAWLLGWLRAAHETTMRERSTGRVHLQQRAPS